MKMSVILLVALAPIFGAVVGWLLGDHLIRGPHHVPMKMFVRLLFFAALGAAIGWLLGDLTRGLN